jgi:hypothetical protein
LVSGDDFGGLVSCVEVVPCLVFLLMLFRFSVAFATALAALAAAFSSDFKAFRSALVIIPSSSADPFASSSRSCTSVLRLDCLGGALAILLLVFELADLRPHMASVNLRV